MPGLALSMSGVGLSDLLSTVAVTVGPESLETLDLVLLGVLNGEWTKFEGEIARGLALDAAHGERVTKDDVRAAATLFRYERGLISAADFRQWLELRGITNGEVSGVLRRLLLRRRFDGHAEPQNRDALTSILRAETLCDGILGRLADRAISLLAAGQLAPRAGDSSGVDPERVEQASSVGQRIIALGPHPPEPAELARRISRLHSLELSARQLRSDVAQPTAVADRLRDHALDWLQLRGQRLTFELEGAAREARLLLRDGESPEDVSERAGTPVLEDCLLVRDAPAGLAGFFAAAAAGDVVGPWEQAGHWHVMQVLSKVPPSAEDASARERAIDELWSEAVERHVAGRTRRHAAL